MAFLTLLTLSTCGWNQTALAQSPTADSFNPGANQWITSLAVQADGKILAGGLFTQIGGLSRSRIARLNTDGTPDSIFNPGANGPVDAMVVLGDGGILVGGRFTTLGGQPRNYIARLDSAGSLDTNFNIGTDGPVSSLAVEPAGSIWVGGSFTTLGGRPRNYIARLDGAGLLDTNFNIGTDAPVSAVAVQPDGKILVGGNFMAIGGQPRNRIARLSADGTLDPSFDPNANNEVYLLVIQADGGILVGGAFTILGGQSRNYIARLNADGTLDASFDPNPGGSRVYSLAAQADGRIVVGGSFRTLSGQSRDYIGRLHADGTPDPSFNPGANGVVTSLALQADGKILVGGAFTTLGGQPRNWIGRLNYTDQATNSLGYDGAIVIWLRGGTAPEVWRTTFEHTTNRILWTMLGEGVRIPGGWELGGVTVGLGAIRARGYTSGGDRCASGGIIEAIVSAPFIAAQPTDRTNTAGTTATLTVAVIGSAPFTYQWRKDGVNLTDGGNIVGAATATMNIGEVLGNDAGGYDVVVNNAHGSVTSVVATLTVVDPAITIQPVSQVGQLGSNITFSVAATGTGLSYQWRKDGVELPEATDTLLTVSHLQPADVGNYVVVVCGSYGCVTSVVAELQLMAELDPIFNPSADGPVNSLVVQTDGKILVGGSFTNLDGQPRNRIARLNADGTLDPSFNPGASSTVSSLLIQPDGKIVVGGSFTNLAGQTRIYIARLNADGTLDPGFNPGASGWFLPSVYSLAMQPDGTILVGGSFTDVAGQARANIARLNPDGTIDPSFNPGANGSVSSLAVQADGKILVVGPFTILGGQPRSRIARLAADGTLDPTFIPGASNFPSSLVVQADGKILVGGRFTTLAGQPRNYIARLNTDGTLDQSFNPGANNWVLSLALQADGKVLVGGWFTTLGGQPRNRLARLNTDGTLDPSFDPGASGSDNPGVSSLVVLPDGKVLAGGSFTNLGGQSRNSIARINSTGTATDALSYPADTITWMRGGGAPEVWRTSFEHSTNGTLWTMLGEGVRIPGGWQLGGVSVTNGNIRARGYATGGNLNASGGIFESIMDATIGTSDFRLRLENVPGQAAQKRLIFSPRWTNRTYAPLFSTNPTTGALWTNLTSTTTNDHGTERTITDLDATGSSKFYRIQISSP